MTDRDRAIERLVRESGGGSAGPAAETCLDAETLAAWADGTLGAARLQVAEEHAADCARCQALLAAMVRTAPTAEPRLMWSRALRWLVPITAAATAVALWIAVPGQDGLPVLDRVAEVRERQALELAAENEETAAEALRPEQSEPSTLEESVQRRDQASATAGFRVEEPAADERNARAETIEPAAKSPDGALADVEIARPAPATPADQAAPAVAETVQSTPATLGRSANALASQRGALRQSAAVVEVRSPLPAVRWRAQGAGVVEHTIDGGITWQPQATTADTTLLAGSAPTSSVCWLVGQGGTVVVTTDAARWRRLPFPEPIDLVAVEAVDAARATVTAADGRSFGTSDGGATWFVVP